jgi:anti-sigma factor RsiW
MTDHDLTLLGPYVLGVLDAAEVHEVEEHLRGCADCRQQVAELEEMKQFLGEVPPEAFLDGPPTDGDLLLQRTLRAARALDDPAVPVVAASRRPRWLMAAASMAVIAAAALGGGVLIGRQTVDQVPSQTTVAGSKQATATETSTGVAMATTVEPRAGWSWVNVRITGLKAGAECEMVVTDADGETHVAGSWVVTEEAAREGSKFGGGVLVPIDQVASVEVKTAQGEHVVTTTL